MKFYKRPKRTREFSGRVEVAISPIDKTGTRMSNKDGIERKSLRMEETTPEEVYQIIYKALQRASEK